MNYHQTSRKLVWVIYSACEIKQFLYDCGLAGPARPAKGW